jgi:peptidoglycan hydrolase-like protein with peptidoglycan-binding domain
VVRVRSRAALAATVLHLALCAGCSNKEVQHEAAHDGRVLRGRQAALELGLALGASGEGVRELQSYLATYGYLANSALSALYPKWAPTTGADEPGTFGKRTETALLALQRRAGLPQTGRLDTQSIDLFARARCGVPEGASEYDRGGAYSLEGSTWSKTSLTWRVVNAPAALSSEVVTSALAIAFTTWQAETNIEFSQATTQADLEVRFAPLDGPGKSFGAAGFPAAGGDIVLDEAEAWTAGGGQATGLDLVAVALHEIGHALGLAHSSRAETVMYPYAGPSRRVLHASDRAAVSALYDTWQPQVPDRVMDIAVGPDDEPWIVYQEGSAGVVYRWSGSEWRDLPGIDGLRIAVAPDGTAWVCDRAGAVFTHSANASEPWVAVAGAGCATDVGVGMDGSVWVVGCPPRQGTVLKWVPPTWHAASGTITAARVSVTPDGVPWIVTDSGAIYRRSTREPAAGEWLNIPGAANDIGIGPDGVPWAVGLMPSSGGFKIYVWNEDASSTLAAPSGQWFPVAGGGINIAGGRAGPRATNAMGALFRQSSERAFFQ